MEPKKSTQKIDEFVAGKSNKPFPKMKKCYVVMNKYAEKRLPLGDITMKTNSLLKSCDYCNNKNNNHRSNYKYCSLRCAINCKFNEITSSSDNNIKKFENTIEKLVDNSKSPGQKFNIKINKGKENKPIIQWSISNVSEFIRDFTGCDQYADEFALQEIDGPALFLLKESHLVDYMGMTSENALKVVQKIKSIIKSVENDEKTE